MARDMGACFLMNWNPRFVWYAKAHGRTPEEQAKQDEKDWPGGCMVGFSQWIQRKRDELCAFYGVKGGDLRNIIGHCGDKDFQKVFDQWLECGTL
jgi:hypothetical protein